MARLGDLSNARRHKPSMRCLGGKALEQKPWRYALPAVQVIGLFVSQSNWLVDR